MQRILLKLLPAALLLSLTACAGYRLGSMLPADIKTVQIPTFENKTGEPLLEVDATRAVIEAVQRDGSLGVASTESSDALLKVVLKSYKLEPVSYSTISRKTTREYRILITASVLMTRRADGSVIVENPAVQGTATFEMLGDLTTSKQRGLPLATDDLAHNIVEKLVEVW